MGSVYLWELEGGAGGAGGGAGGDDVGAGGFAGCFAVKKRTCKLDWLDGREGKGALSPQSINTDPITRIHVSIQNQKSSTGRVG